MLHHGRQRAPFGWRPRCGLRPCTASAAAPRRTSPPAPSAPPAFLLHTQRCAGATFDWTAHALHSESIQACNSALPCCRTHPAPTCRDAAAAAVAEAQQRLQHDALDAVQRHARLASLAHVWEHCRHARDVSGVRSRRQQVPGSCSPPASMARRGWLHRTSTILWHANVVPSSAQMLRGTAGEHRR